MPKTPSTHSGDAGIGPKRPKTSTEEQIFCLNIDCLAEIFTYLPIQDVFKVHKSDARFAEAAYIRYAQGKFWSRSDLAHLRRNIIDQKFIESASKAILDCFMEMFGKFYSCIKFEALESPVLMTVLSKFTNLKYLYLTRISLPHGTNTDALPTGLELLKLEYCRIDTELLHVWIPLLNPTLKYLRVSHCETNCDVNYDALKGLTNLSDLFLEGMIEAFPHLVAELFANNKDQLTDFNTYLKGCRIPDAVWTNMMELDQLVRLSLIEFKFNGAVTPKQALFPRLEDLYIEMWGGDLRLFFNELACEESLKSVIIQNPPDRGSQNLDFLQRFKNLIDLNIYFGDWDDFDAGRCKIFKQLRSLNMSDGSFLRPSQLFDLLNFPNLEELNLSSVCFEDEDNVDPQKVKEQFDRLAKDHKQPFKYEFSIGMPPTSEEEED